MVNTMWHVALKEGTTELQDVIIVAIPFEELEVVSVLLQTDRLKGRSFETDRGDFLMMYDGNSDRPLSEVILWKSRSEGEENVIEDMQIEDAWILEYVWSEWLMPEDTDAEYVPPEQFIVMGRRQP